MHTCISIKCGDVLHCACVCVLKSIDRQSEVREEHGKRNENYSNKRSPLRLERVCLRLQFMQNLASNENVGLY